VEGITLGIIVIWIICGVITAFMGSVKGRSGGGWFFVGFFLGPIGIIIAAIIRRKEPKPEVKLTVNYPSPPSPQDTNLKKTDIENHEEHLYSLLKQATALRDTDIDTAIRIVEQVIKEYEEQDEPFVNLKPIYFKLAYYLQKRGDRDKAWKIYNQMILSASEDEDVLILGMDLADIYSHMASLREKEKGYKDAILFRIRSYINKNEALHLQGRRKEILPLEKLLIQLKILLDKGKIKYSEKSLKRRLESLIKQWKKKPPVKMPFIDSIKKNKKIKKRYILLNQLSKKQLKLIQEDMLKDCKNERDH